MRLIPWQEGRIDELVILWNKELQGSFPMRKELFRQNSFLDENISCEGSRIVVNDDDKVIGFIVVKFLKEAVRTKTGYDIGWIQVLLVDSEYRGRGIGAQLLKHAEAIFQEKGLKLIHLGTDMLHYFPGIPSEDKPMIEWVEKRGYKYETTEVDLTRSYHKDEDIYMPALPNIEFSLLKETEQDNFINFLHRCFPGRWEYEAIDYFQKGGTGREFVVLKENGMIIGFCRINDMESPIIMGNMNWASLFDGKVGAVGPLGVDERKRKNGYGLAIVQAGIAFLRKRGVNQVVIDWTGLIDFYRKLGFEVYKSYETYSKEI